MGRALFKANEVMNIPEQGDEWSHLVEVKRIGAVAKGCFRVGMHF